MTAVQSTYLLLETIELCDSRVALHDLDFEAPGSSAPLGAADVGLVEGEGITAARRLPSQTVFCESALAIFLGKIQVNVVEALAVPHDD